MGLLDKILGKNKKADSTGRSFEGVRSGASSTLRPEPVPPVATPAAGAPAQRTYAVKSGDSLSKISQQFYGNANEWRKIYEANRDQIKNPDLIYPGQKFIIP